MKVAHEQMLSAAWNMAAFARQERLKPLAHYLGETKRKGGGNARAIAMFRRASVRLAKDESNGNG